MKPLCGALLAAALIVGRPASTLAQTAPVGTPLSKVVLVHIRLDAGGDRCSAYFDADGQPIAGQSEADLQKKFARFKSPASVINFMRENGYRIIQFTAVPAGTSRYGGGGASEGTYVVMFEPNK